jgi:hypothetical protein
MKIMENPKINELRKKRDELRGKATQMRKNWIKENPDKIRMIQKRQSFFKQLIEKHQTGEGRVSESASGKLTTRQRISALVSLIAIVAFIFFAMDYIGRAQRALEQVKKYQELVKNYEELGNTDTDLLYNCVESELMEPTDDNMSQNSKESAELLDAKEATIKTINGAREELGLDKSGLNIWPRKGLKLLPETF